MAKKAAPDFGKGGRLKVREDEQAAVIRLSAGERIRMTLTANGPGQALFAFGCQHKSLWNAPDFPGHPKKVYEWVHLDQPADADAPADTYALTIAFVGGITSYTFLMEHVSAAGANLATLKDFDASSTVASDVFHSAITLLIA
jgi:hypothetical protein